MVTEATGAEYLLIRKTANDYRSRGYEVSLEAPLDFMHGFRADLVARKGDEVKVIEVKSRSSLGAIPQIGELAKRVDAKEGWSFELVLVGEPEALDAPEGMHPCDGATVLERIEQAEKALAAGLPEAALLLAWSAVEAGARESLAAEGVPDPRVLGGRGVFDQAVLHGIVSRDEYNHLVGLAAYRNAIVHGFRVEDFDEEMARRVVDTAREMIRTMSEGAIEAEEAARP